MRTRNLTAPIAAAVLALSAVSPVLAQTGTTAPPPKKGILSRLHDKMAAHKPGPKTATTVGSGKIIGNKNTKVYHLAGDKGMMPAEKNRVYFKTEAQAKAAGYHVAKAGAVKPKATKTKGSFGKSGKM